jgi:hypothetical protein
MILVIVSLYSFLGNSALLGPSVYIGIYSQEFGITPSTASGLISYPNLAFGFGKAHQLILHDHLTITHAYRLIASRPSISENWKKTCYATVFDMCT